MTTQDIANRLVEICHNGDFEKAQSELFADEAVSIEPYATPAFEKEIKGLKAIKQKSRKMEFDGAGNAQYRSFRTFSCHEFICLHNEDGCNDERGR